MNKQTIDDVSIAKLVDGELDHSNAQPVVGFAP